MTPQTIDVTIPVVFSCLSPLHHGAGVSGNTQLQRVQELVDENGRLVTVPFVSGNSLRHKIRVAAAQHLLESIEVEFGTLRKEVVDLLFTGGALTTTGANIDLEAFRRLENLWPASGLLGYAARSHIWSGSLFVDHTHLVCRENVWRIPEQIKQRPDLREHLNKPAAQFIDEDFGTRHDIAGTIHCRWINTDLWTGQDTTQMIYDWQVVRAGARMWTTISLQAAPIGHVTALMAAWYRMLDDESTMRLGAKGRQGYGHVRVDADLSTLPEVDLEGYREQLSTNRVEIIRLLEEVA